MKRISYLLSVAFISLSILFPANCVACDYKVMLYDSYGDGWNGGTLSIYANGSVVLQSLTLESGYGPATFYFTVSHGDVITAVYTGGSWSYENYYYIYDSQGGLVFGDGINETTPVGGLVGNAVCPDYDLSIDEWISPKFLCNTSIENISVLVVNRGVYPVSNFSVSYSIDGGATFISETLDTTLNPGDSLIHTFTVPANFSLYNLYACRAVVHSNLDQYPSNDTLIHMLPVSIMVNTFPYYESFEANQGYWYAGGVNNSWEWGVPNSLELNTAYDGTKAWVTNLIGYYNANEVSWVESPCFDFTGLINPEVEFAIWYDISAWYDGAAFQYTTDGIHWYHLGQVNSGINWYNDWDMNCMHVFGDDQGWTDESNGWLVALHNMQFLAGEPFVKFRFVFSSSPSYGGLFPGFGFDWIHIFQPPDMHYEYAAAFHGDTNEIAQGNPDAQIIGVNVNTSGRTLPISIESLHFSSTGSTSPSTDIVNARVYYTGGNPNFDMWTQYGNTVSAKGSFDFVQHLQLVEGNNYFWLVYHVDINATPGNVLDATLDSLFVDDTMRIPNIGNPAGNHPIIEAMAGTYIIDLNGSGDFLSFTEALDELKYRGVKDSVIFLVKPGQYFERLLINSILGASAQNTITFKSFSGDPNSVVLTQENMATEENFIIHLQGARYFIFKDMTIKAMQSTVKVTYGNVIKLTNNAHHNTFENNIIEGIQTSGTSTEYYVIRVFNFCEHIKIYKNVIKYGSTGIYVYGYSSTNYANGIEIIGNEIINFNYMGMSLLYLTGPVIKRNKIYNGGTYTTVYGIYLYYIYDPAIVYGNDVLLPGVGTRYGIHANYLYNTAKARHLVANNFVSITQMNATAIHSGINFNVVQNGDIVHNSVRIGSSNASGRALLVQASPGTMVLNNILSCPGGTLPFWVTDTTNILSFGHNVLHTTGLNMANISGLLISQQQYKQLLSITHDIITDPEFFSATDLHTMNPVINNIGTPFPDVPDDIDGELRSTTQPDPGADEFSPPPYEAALLNITQPISECNIGNTPVGLLIMNRGSDTINGGLTAYYSMDGQPAVSTLVNAVLAPMDTLLFIFPVTEDFSALHTDTVFSLHAWITLTGDTISSNDSIYREITSLYTPNPPLTSDVTISFGNEATLTVTSTDEVHWFADSLLNAPLHAGATYITPPLYDHTTFYATAQGPGPDLKITEIMVGYNSTGATAIYPTYTPAGDWKCIEITNLGQGAAVLDNYSIEIWTTTGITWTFPTNTILGSGQVMLLVFYAVNPVFDDPVNNFYVMANNINISTYTAAGFVLRSPSKQIVDAVGLYGYNFIAASGVTMFDWTGSLSSGGRAGISRSISDNNRATDWYVPSNTSRQTIGSVNIGLAMNRGTGCMSYPAGATAFVTNVPALGIPSVDPDTLTAIILDCDGSSTLQINISNLGDTLLDWSTAQAQQLGYDSTSYKVFTTSGATTTHTFNIGSTLVDTIFLLITLNGDFSDANESCNLLIDGNLIGTLNDGDFSDGIDIPIPMFFTGSSLQNWISDGVITVTLTNSAYVGSGWGTSSHQVQLTIKGRASWISIPNTNGSIAVSGSQQLNITFNASGLIEGTYVSYFPITFNTPRHPRLDITCVLTLVGAPEIAFQDSCLELGNIMQHTQTSTQSALFNLGCDTLYIDSLNISIPEYSAQFSSWVVIPGGMASFNVQFSASQVGSFPANLTLHTNIGDTSICLLASTFPAPIVGTSTDTLLANILLCDDSTTLNFTIANSGLSELQFEINDFSTGLPRAACIPYTSNYCCNMGIYEVQFAGINSITGNGSEGYQDYTATQRASVIRGQSYPIYVRTGPDYLEDVRAWIDWNDDGVFDISELVFESNNVSIHHTGNILVPNHVIPGRAIRMRVASDYYSQPLPNACGSVYYGQHEDYTVVISGGIKIEPQQGSLSALDDTSISVTFYSLGFSAGEHPSIIRITSNDPLTPVKEVIGILNLIGVPEITYEPTSLDLDSSMVGATLCKEVMIYNPGCKTLFVSNITTNSPSFYAAQTSIQVTPGDSIPVSFCFSPQAVGVHNGIAEIHNNAQNVFVNLIGLGLPAPNIVVDPDSFSLEIASCHDSIQKTITIYNTGSYELDFTVLSTTGESALDSVLTRLNQEYVNITSLIPNRFDFSEGESGNNISDGSGDMYDGGNYLNTNYLTSIAYSNNSIITSSAFGSNGRYFTRKYPGLWVMAANLNDVNFFEISGNLGADGAGNVDATILNTTVNGTSFLGYVKRVYNAGDPSVNHLIIVQDNPNTSHTFSTNTDNDQHRVSGLNGINRIYYLLYAGTSGYYINDDATLAIMKKFLSVINPAPDWIHFSKELDTVPPADSSEIVATFRAQGLLNGTYLATLEVHSNDPDEALVIIPVSFTVEGLPEVVLSKNVIDYGYTMMGTAPRDTILIYNKGCDALDIDSMQHTMPSEFSIQFQSMQIAPFDSTKMVLTYHPTYTGQVDDTLILFTNGGTAYVSLSGFGIPEPIISTSPTAFNVDIYVCDDTIEEMLTIYNTGLGGLEYQLIGGYGTSYDSTSTKYYTTSGASTTHTFPNISLTTDSIILIVTINGDFDYSYEYASLYIEGQFIAQIDDGNPANGTNIVRSYSFNYQQIQAWLADGILQVQIQNSYDVDHWSGLVSMHRVQLIINSANWMNFSAHNGTVPTGDSSSLIISFGAEGLLAGTYYSQIIITSNDPYNPTLHVPCTVNVIGSPEMEIVPLCLHFDTILVGNSALDTLHIVNNGCSALLIQGTDVTHPAFTIQQSPAQILPLMQGIMVVQFAPDSARYFEDTLFIQTNDGLVAICLTGTGAAPPILDYSPLSFNVAITQCNDAVTLPLTIGNIGVEDLHFNITGPGTDTVRILGLIHASSATYLDYVINALDQQFKKYSVQTYSGNTAAGLQLALQNIDVVILPRFSSTSTTAYSSFAPVLQNFINQGGIVIFTGVYDASLSQNMYVTGLFTGNYVSYITGGTIVLNNLQDPLLQGLPSSIAASQYVFYHNLTNPDLITLATYGSAQVIAYRNIGKGKVMYMGYDFVAYQAQAALILSRMVDLGIKGKFEKWITLDKTSDTVAGGQSTTVQVLFDAWGLTEGIYESGLVIQTNVPGKIPDTIPCTLTLTGAPFASVPQTCVDLGSVMIGGMLSGSFTITNEGCADLIVTGSSHMEPAFTNSIIPFVLPPGNTYTVSVTFTSTATGTYTDTITLLSNIGAIEVCLQAVALSAPEVEINPENLSATIQSCNDSTTVNVIISNPGNAPLNWSVPSQMNPGHGLLFNGTSDFVDLGTWNTGTRWTIEAWVNPTSSPAGRRTIAGAVHQCADWALSMVDGQFALIIKPATAICSYILYSGFYPIPGTWYHIAGTSNGSQATLMINGEVFATANVSLNYTGTSSGVRIGGEFCCYGNSFPGRIDDVRIWNLARTSNQIKANMFSSLIGSETGLVGYWPMDEGSGTSLIDHSSMGRNGIILGATWIPDTKPSSWITAHPASGIVGIAATDTIDIVFRSKGLNNGTYIKNLLFATDDPVHPQTAVACTLTVDGSGQLSIPGGCLVFNPTMQYMQSSQQLVIQNTGCEIVTVSSITCPNTFFSINPSTFNLVPGSSQTVQVNFAPTASGNHNTSLSIASSIGTFDKCIQATATERPVAQLGNDTVQGMPTCSNTEVGWITMTNLGNPSLTLTYSFQPSVSWVTLITASPLSIPGGSAATINMMFDKTGLTNGNYQTQLIIQTNDPLNPVMTVLIKLIVPNILAPVSLGKDTAACTGMTITLDAGAGYATYSWNTMATTQSIQAATTGTYVVDVIDFFGCTSSDSIFVGFYDNPSVSLGSDRAVCEGYGLSLSGSVTGLPSINQVDVVIGSGTNFTSNNTATPFKTFFADGRTQLLYSKVELAQAGFAQGIIRTIGIMVGAPGAPPMLSFTIKMGEVSQGILTNFLVSLQVVYERSSYQPVAGWNTFVLDNPLLYTGQGNLLVEICFDNAIWSTNSTVQYTTVANSVWGMACDNCSAGCSLGGGSGSNLRTNLRIIGENMRATYTWQGPSGYTSNAYQINLTNVQALQAGDYILMVDNGWGCVGRDTVLVTVMPTPMVDAGPSDTILEGNYAQLSGLATGGETPYSISWTPPGQLTNPLVLDPIASPTTTTTYTLMVTGANGCQASDQTKITVIPVFDITGRLYYANAAQTGLADVEMVLSNLQEPYDTTTTDYGGGFAFRAPYGNYYLDAKINKTWGGANATDALEVAKYAVYLTNLTGIKLAAADVNLSGTINATDALLIMRRFVGLTDTFPAPDWLYMPRGMISVLYASYTGTIEALCAGDVNGSFIPGKQTPSMVTLDYKQTAISGNAQSLTIPVYTENYLEAGAISLEFIIPKEFGRIKTISTELEGLIFNQQGQILRIAWHETQSRIFQTDEAMLHLTFEGAQLSDEPLLIQLGQYSEIANHEGTIQDVKLYTLPVIAAGSQVRLGENYPDPFSYHTHIPYFLPYDAEIVLSLHDMLGRQLAVIDQGRRLRGSHLLTFDGSHWQPGLYFFRLQIDGTSIDIPTCKMVISR